MADELRKQKEKHTKTMAGSMGATLRDSAKHARAVYAFMAQQKPETRKDDHEKHQKENKPKTNLLNNSQRPPL